MVFASGGGGNFSEICTNVKLCPNVQVSLLVVDNKCGAINIAKANGVPVTLINFDNDSEETISKDEKIINCDLIALCGFNRILPHEFLKKIRMPVLNTHPSLLPAYGGGGMIGVKVHRLCPKQSAAHQTPLYTGWKICDDTIYAKFNHSVNIALLVYCPSIYNQS